MTKSILILPGDGVGPEVTGQVLRIVEAVNDLCDADLRIKEMLIGGAAIDEKGTPLPAETLAAAHAADAVFLGAVGGQQWNELPMEQRPEKALLRLRSELKLYSNLRPAYVYPQLMDASPLKMEVVSGVDVMIVRELTGGVYFSEPRGVAGEGATRYGFNTYAYSVEEIERIARMAFTVAQQRRRKLCSVDKANVLEVTALWREVVTELAPEYPDVNLSHMYVDNAAMQLIRCPRQFDVLLADNIFGDILSDIMAVLAGSMGMLPSASLNEDGRGLYEPVHGSAPDIAGQDIANPLAAILSLVDMMRYSLDLEPVALLLEQAVREVLETGLRTWDIMPERISDNLRPVGTKAMGDAVLDAFEKQCVKTDFSATR